LKKIYEKYKDIIPYLFFGVCTTAVNVIVYWVAAYPLGFSIMTSTVLAWVIAVLFAYITNRKWVFHSKFNNRKEIIREMMAFFTCRLTTGFIDWLCMWFFVDILEIYDVIIKFAANILVIGLNYLASKLVIFRKRDKYE